MKVLEDLPGLRIVDLSDNELLEMPKATKDAGKFWTQLTLSKNPFQAGAMDQLQKWLPDTRIIYQN